jgi:hypothetical protein
LIASAVLGLALALAPVAFGMFDRAPQGAVMLSEFKPFMTHQRLDGYVGDIGEINAAVHETDTKAVVQLGTRDAPVTTGSYAQLSQQWPQIDGEMTRLLTTVQANVGNYQDVAALPSFRLFPWFFVIPGALIFLVSLIALAGRLSRRAGAAVLAVLGLGLIAAPLAFQMFTRAPAGGRMMSAFSQLETTSEVTKIQGYFSTMASGQGALRLQIVPALVATGVPPAQLAHEFPATAALDHDWIKILNDLTPMIGAMSDNVGHYHAIKSLPPFPLFPWFFVIPGILVAGLAWTSRTRRDPLGAL